MHTVSFQDLLQCWIFGVTHLFPPFSSLAHLLLFRFGIANISVHVCAVILPNTSLMVQYSFLYFFIFQNDKLVFHVFENALELLVEY